MSKNIILLSDGTGKSAASPFKTNVWRLYQALDLTKDDQVAFYDDGVGTSAVKPLALIGGAFGFGLKRNVKELYKNLCQSYEDGDRIYAFGFSRGAFTIRVLVGLIASQGIIQGRNMDPETLRREVEKAYRRDRKAYETSWRKIPGLRRNASRHDAEQKFAVKRNVPKGNQPATISFVGVWDTVDAYGLPIDELKRGLDRWFLGLSFPDQDLSPIVQRACHAIALDDKRRTFHPLLWNEKFESELQEKKVFTQPRMKQVWFAGMHSNVGGGYPKDGLAYVSLGWMVQEALAAEPDPTKKIRFLGGAIREIQELSNIHGEMGNSRAGLGSYYRYDPRRVGALCRDDYSRVWIERPKIHYSVFERIKGKFVTYVPHMMPGEYDVVDQNGNVTANHYEKPGDAKKRSQDLERAWDLVWWRRLVYLATIFVSAILVLFPWIWHAAEAPPCSWGVCLVGNSIVAIGNFLPGWVDPWVESFGYFPGTFTIFALALASTMLLGAWLEKRIEARSTEAWGQFAGLKSPTLRQFGFLSWIARQARTTGWLVAAYRWTTRDALPFVCFLAVVAVVLAGTNKLAFEFWEASGYTCKGTEANSLKDAKDARTLIAITFHTSDFCFATGVQLLAGRSYVIEFQIEEPWIDGTKLTSPQGFSSAEGGILFRLAAPLRRSWTGKWFEPIARIGDSGRERYELRPQLEKRTSDSKAAADRSKTQEARPDEVYTSKQFIAQITGELFLFANDAVIALPGFLSWFYSGKIDDSALCDPPDNPLCKYRKCENNKSNMCVNNKGSAKIVVRVSAPAQ